MTETPKNTVVPEEFTKVIKDFIGDMRDTFPEYNPLINKWWYTYEEFQHIENEIERNTAYENAQIQSTETLFEFCQKKFPPRFFDILYQNNKMFEEDSDLDTEFLPAIHFKNLWQFDITEKTRETIWKYLQLIMFSIIGTIHNKDSFGDTAKLFENINQDEFKTKLSETITHIQQLFDKPNFKNADENADETSQGINMENIPNAEQIHDHITNMLDGKLGQLAREIAEETASNLNMDFDGATDMTDVFQKLVQNPSKMMNLVKTVGDKLDTKLKSGDLKESELISEATNIMNQMKNMPGMDNIQAMLSKLGMGGMNMGGMNGKVNVGAMESQLNSKMKMAKTKERIRAKAQAKIIQQAATAAASNLENERPVISEEEILKLFSSEEKVERTPRRIDVPGDKNNKKKKNNKK